MCLNRTAWGAKDMRVCDYQILTRQFFTFLIVALIGTAASSTSVSAQVSITSIGVPYTQDFNTLPASGSATWVNNSTIPGWFHARTGTGTTIVAQNGSSNAGNLYSYGTGTDVDRSLGSLGSGNAAIGNLYWGVRLQNNTGTTITSLQVSYTGEQWRNSAAAAQTITFSYLIGSPTVTGSLAEFQSAGVAVAALDFTSPITGGTALQLDGNLAANRTSLSFTISNISIPNGTEVMLRWADPDHTGADHGLSIDDFSVTALVPSAAAVSISGRVVNGTGDGIPRAIVTINHPTAGVMQAVTNPFGYYSFPEVEVGATVMVSVTHKGYTFDPQVVSVNDEIANLIFVAQ